MKLRTLLVCGLAICGLANAATPAFAQDTPEQIIAKLYPTQTGVKVTSDKLWRAFPDDNTTPQLSVDIKLSTVGSVAFGIISPTATDYSTFGAFTGTRTLDQNNNNTPTGGQLYKLSAPNRYQNAGASTTIDVPNTPSPFAWDVRLGALPNTNAGGFTSPSGTWNQYLTGQSPTLYQPINGSNQFDSQRNDGNMVAYRLPDGTLPNGDKFTRFILFWELDNTPSNGYDLVVEVTGVMNPEPTSLALMGFGAAGLLGYRLRRRAAKAAPAV